MALALTTFVPDAAPNVSAAVDLKASLAQFLSDYQARVRGHDELRPVLHAIKLRWVDLNLASLSSKLAYLPSEDLCNQYVYRDLAFQNLTSPARAAVRLNYVIENREPKFKKLIEKSRVDRRKNEEAFFECMETRFGPPRVHRSAQAELKELKKFEERLIAD